MALEPGQIISDTYRVDRLLGSGGMAEVYRVIHTRLPKHFALKLMKLTGRQRGQFLARFRREAEILGGLKHPHIVEVIDWNELPDGSPYLVMELLDGEDLSSFLGRTGTLSMAVTLHICKQVGEALTAAHARGVIHRDLKPANVFLCRNGPFPNYVKVLDFGVAKVVDVEKTPLTASASLMGTPGYMAPEQAMGRIHEIDGRTDQFSLAAMLYEMLSGQPAFYRPGETMYNILNRVVNEHPPPLAPPQASEQVSQAVTRALSKQKEQRFPSMQDFLTALGVTSQIILIAGASSSGLRPPSTVDRVGEMTLPPRRRRRVLYAAIGAGAGLILSSAGLFKLAGSERPRPVSVAVPPQPAVAPVAPPPAPVTPILQPVAPQEELPEVTDRPAKHESSAGRRPSSRTAQKSAAGKGAGQPRKFVIQGTRNPVQEHAIRLCATKELADVSLAFGTVIKLERSGTLQIVEAPPAVTGSSFGECLRQAFLNMSQLAIPESVMLRVSR